LNARRLDAICRFGIWKGTERHYAVADLAGRYFLDARRRHRITLRLENLFDSAYATGHGRGFPDLGNTPYVTSTRGVPRTLHVSYTLAY